MTHTFSTWFIRTLSGGIVGLSLRRRCGRHCGIYDNTDNIHQIHSTNAYSRNHFQFRWSFPEDWMIRLFDFYRVKLQCSLRPQIFSNEMQMEQNRTLTEQVLFVLALVPCGHTRCEIVLSFNRSDSTRNEESVLAILFWMECTLTTSFHLCVSHARRGSNSNYIRLTAALRTRQPLPRGDTRKKPS